VKLAPKWEKARVGLANVQLLQGKLREAKESFELASRLDPADASAYLGLSQVYYQAGSPRNAIPPLQKCLALEPKKDSTWYSLGKLYEENRQSDLAIDAMHKAIAINPDRGVYWRDLAQLSRHYSKLKEAQDQLKKALHLDPNDALAYYYLGQLSIEMGDTPELHATAEQALNSATSREPTMQGPYFELGRLYERNGNFAVAAAKFKKAHELDLSDDKALYHYGVCLMRQGDTVEGKKLIDGSRELAAVKWEAFNLENRIRTEPQNRPLRLRIARLYRKFGNAEGAMNQYQVYLNMGPRDAGAVSELEAYLKQTGNVAALPYDCVTTVRQ
jgi:tetratricopeptide (TPR) repeat protein